jgi:hypothetical protein
MDVPNFVMGLGSLIAGISSLSNAFKKKQRRGVGGLGKLAMTGQHDSINGGPSARIFRVNNIDDRLAAVAQMVMISIRDPRVRQLAVSIVSKRCNEPNHKTGDGGWCLDERDYWGEVQAIFYWMRANVRYVRDPSTIDTFATAMRTIEAHGGDCDDYQIALAALLMTIGYPVKMKTIRTKDFADWNHIYLVVGLPPGKPTKWRALDASVKQPAGWEAPASIIAQARVDSPDDRKWVGYF